MALQPARGCVDNWEVAEERPLDVETREQAAAALLARHPTALIAAITDQGLFVPMPASVPVTTQQVSRAWSALDLVRPADRPTVITLWDRARSVGAAQAEVHLATVPEQAAVMHCVDVRERHGVYLGLVVAEDNPAALREVARTVTARPARVARSRKDRLAVFLAVDPAITQILGWPVEEMVGRRSLEFVHPDDHDRAIENWMAMLATPGSSQRARLRHRAHDGRWVWLEVTNTSRLDDAQHGDVDAEMVDISDEMAAQEALRDRERLLDRLAEALPIGLLQVDAERRVLYTNERLHEILGSPRAGTVDHQLASVIAHDLAALAGRLDAALGRGVDGDLEVRVQSPGDGELRRCTMRIRALTDDDGSPIGAILCVEDVTESAEMRAELERRATYDMLTRCYNRSSVIAVLEAALTRADGAGTGVIFVDIDEFKSVNDRLGHAAGDELLSIIASRIGACIRADDVVGRIGGDEFLVVCSGVDGAAETLDVATRIAQTLRGEVALSRDRVALCASVGVAYTDGQPTTADDIVAQADAAMYASKRARQCLPVLFTDLDEVENVR